MCSVCCQVYILEIAVVIDTQFLNELASELFYLFETS